MDAEQAEDTDIQSPIQPLFPMERPDDTLFVNLAYWLRYQILSSQQPSESRTRSKRSFRLEYHKIESIL